MLRALCLLALLLPSAEAQELEPVTLGFVTSDSLVFPMLYFDGEQWSRISAAEVASRGTAEWESVGGSTMRRLFFRSEPDTVHWIEFSDQEGGGKGLPVVWGSTTPTYGIAFSPKAPDGVPFVTADSSFGSSFVRGTLADAGWKGSVRGPHCVAADLPPLNRPLFCYASGTDYRPNPNPNSRITQLEAGMYLDRWVWADGSTTSRVEVPSYRKAYGLDYDPVYLITGTQPFIVGMTEGWGYYSIYVAPAPIRYDQTGVPEGVLEGAWGF
jgi:hypothetical protein